MSIFNIISLAGGIALFLYGMSIMGSGLEKIAGGKMEGVLRRLTSSTVRAVALGAVITGNTRSSVGTTVIVIGLVNSGIMELSQAIGVIMGANIGTTVTGQLIRLSDISGGSLLLELCKPNNFAPLVAFAGAILYVFLKARKSATSADHDRLRAALHRHGHDDGVRGAAARLTAVHPSVHVAAEPVSRHSRGHSRHGGDSVVVGVRGHSAGAVRDGPRHVGQRRAIILGQNIGTCSTPLIASIGASKAAKRSAVVHLYFNVIGSLVFMAVIYGLRAVIGFSWWNETMNMATSRISTRCSTWW